MDKATSGEIINYGAIPPLSICLWHGT